MTRINNTHRPQLLTEYAAWRGTNKDFCAAHQVPRSTFYKWLKRERAKSPKPGFVEVRQKPAAVTANGGASMSMRFGSVELVLHEAPEPQWMAAVIEHLA